MGSTMEPEKMNRHLALDFPQRFTRVLTIAAFAAISLFATDAVLAAKARSSKSERSQAEQEIAQEAAEGKPSKYRTVTYTFKQMGAWSSIKLRGVDGFRELAFPVRADEVVVAAKLRIAYDYSPALIPELSHLKVSLNDRIAAVEPLPRDRGVGNTREINLDPRFFYAENNFLRFKLIGHYTRQCEDPFHSSLWLTLSDLGRLELTLAPLTLTSDLKNLPAPFFDKRENTPLRLPFVFANNPTQGTLQAAGIVSSWFGMQAGTRGAQFPASINTLPDGNAVVFLQTGDNVAGVKGSANASISIQPHPTHPYAKLLVISGSGDVEMARAAKAIALIAPTLVGQQVNVTKETETAPRKPYDAPAWLPTDRAVKFGELAKPEELRVHAYYPDAIRLNYRVSPDLFTWRTLGSPVKLKYRAIDLPLHQNSSLNINHNTNFIEALALNEPYKTLADGARLPANPVKVSGLRQETVYIPPYSSNGRDQFQLNYYFDIIKEGECRAMPPENLQASIDAESTIDFSGFPHYVALPNLAYFSSIGFPFTRMADLSETAVVMPDAPNADEIGLYLTVMGRMGESTAYPVLRHSVVGSAGVDKVSGKDLIVIGSAKNQALMDQWANNLPMVTVEGQRRVKEPDATWRPRYRWAQEDIQTSALPKGNLQVSGAGGLAAIMAFESPLQSKRSVVFMYADKPADLRKITDVLSDPERMNTIHGDFAVVDDKNVSHTKVSETYYLGSLPVMSKVQWFFSDQPLLIGFLGLVVCLLLATLAYRLIRRIRTKRAKKVQ